MTPLRRVAQLSAAFLCSNVARAGIGLGLALVLGRALGPVRFGGWILCTAWASTVTVIVDLGFGVLLTRDGARGDSDPARLLTGALALRLLAAVPLAVVLAMGAEVLSADREVVAALRIAAVLGAAGAAYGCFGSLLRSQPRWLPVVLAIETAWLAVQAAGSWWLVSVGRGVPALLALAAGLQAAQIATALALWRPVFGARAAMPFAAPPRLFNLLGRALPFALSGIVANLQARLGPLMLGALATPTDVGWFGAASRIGRGVKLAPQALFAGALPVLAQAFDRDAGSATRLSGSLDRALAMLSLSTSVVCAILAPILMSLVFGRPFTAAAPTLVWIASGLVPSVANSARKVFLYAAGLEAVVVRWSAAALAVQALTAAGLIPLFGSAGAAAALAIGEAAIWLPLRRTVPCRETAQRATRTPSRRGRDGKRPGFRRPAF